MNDKEFFEQIAEIQDKILSESKGTTVMNKRQLIINISIHCIAIISGLCMILVMFHITASAITNNYITEKMFMFLCTLTLLLTFSLLQPLDVIFNKLLKYIKEYKELKKVKQ